MVICPYFLKGRCKFGDRCFNEHRKNEQRDFYHKGHRNNVNQGYHDQKNYQDDRGFSGSYQRGGGHDRGGGRQSYDSYDSSYGGNRGGGGRNNYNDGYGGNRGGRNDHGGSQGGGSNRGYDNHGGNKAGGRNPYRFDARDQSGNHNRYAALSHQPDPEPPSSQQRSRARTSSNQNLQLADHKLERIRKDMREWNDSGQWPFSCYATLADEPCFGGLVDISPEELRDEAYKANSSGNPANYTQSLQGVMESYVQKKREFANMSLTALQQEMAKSPTENTTTSGLFGNLTSSAPTIFGGNSTSLFGTSSQTTSSGGLFGSSSQSMSTTGPFSSSALPASTTSPALPASTTSPAAPFGSTSGPFGSSSGPFGTSSGTSQDSSSLFGSTQPMPSISTDIATTSSAQKTDAPTLSQRCSEQDMRAFKQDYFVLGAIPEYPPPPELC